MLALVCGPAAGALAAGLLTLEAFGWIAGPGLTTGLTMGLDLDNGLLANVLLVAILPLLGAALALAGLTGVGLGAALLEAGRLPRAFAEDPALAFTVELLLRTGRLAVGIFWTLLKI